MRLATASLAALCACSSGVAVVSPPPMTDGTHALVLAVEAGPTFEVHAAAVVDGVAATVQLSRAIDPGVQVHFEALRYDDTLEQLGLIEGPLESVTGTRSSRLPDPAEPLLKLDLTVGNDPTNWTTSDQRSQRLDAFRIEPPRGRCAEFKSRVGNLSGLRQPAFAEQIEPGVTLIGTDQERLFTVSETEVVQIQTSIFPDFRSLFVPLSGVMMFGSYSGSVIRAHLRPQLTIDEVRWTNLGNQIAWISGAPSVDPPDYFTMNIMGVVEHYDGKNQQVVYQAPGEPSDINIGGVAWVGSREAVVVWPAELGVTRIKYDTTTGQWSSRREETPGARAAFISASYNPRFGAVVANSEGQFFTDRDGAWAELPGSPTRVFIFTLAPYLDGFVYGTGFGNFGQFVPAEGFCPLVTNAIAGDIRDMSVMSTGAVVVTSRVAGQTPAYGMLIP